MGVREAKTAPSQRIDVAGPDSRFVVVRADVAVSQVIGQDQQDVRMSCNHLGRPAAAAGNEHTQR